jgi:hypothetical protein
MGRACCAPGEKRNAKRNLVGESEEDLEVGGRLILNESLRDRLG